MALWKKRETSVNKEGAAPQTVHTIHLNLPSLHHLHFQYQAHSFHYDKKIWQFSFKLIIIAFK
jgi:hypothetical protein